MQDIQDLEDEIKNENGKLDEKLKKYDD